MTLALDGHVTGLANTGSSVATTTGLTTTNAGDVIAAFVQIKSTTLLSVTSLSGTGIVWNASARKTLTYNTTFDLELWYGTAAATLSAITVTANFSGTMSGTGTGKVGVISVFGISGANTSVINDGNASVPATATGSSSIPTATGVSTSNPNTFIIGGVSVGTTGLTETAGGGFTLIDTVIGNSNSTLASEFQVVSAKQSGLSVAFGTSATGAWGMIADAVQAPGGTGPPPGGDITQMVLDAHRISYQG